MSGSRIFAQVPGLKKEEESEGETDITKLETSGDRLLNAQADRIKEIDASIRAQMSPPGGIRGLHPAVEKARLQYGIIDKAFDADASFDTIIVWQIPMADYAESEIVMPDVVKQRIQEETPRGIILSAGLGAMDHLWAHGYELGDRILFVRMAPWRVPIGRVAGSEHHVLPLMVGDIRANFSAAERRREGKTQIVFDSDTSQWLVKDKGGLRKKGAPYVEPAYGG